MQQTSDSIESELRAAVLASDHQEVMRLSAAYTEALRRQWARLSAEERAQSRIPKQSLDLLAWVREMTIVQQAFVAEDLSSLQKTARHQAARALYLLFASDAPSS